MQVAAVANAAQRVQDDTVSDDKEEWERFEEKFPIEDGKVIVPEFNANLPEDIDEVEEQVAQQKAPPNPYNIATGRGIDVPSDYSSDSDYGYESSGDEGGDGIAAIPPVNITYTDAFLLELRASLVKKITPYARYSSIDNDNPGIYDVIGMIFNRYGKDTIINADNEKDLITKLKVQTLLLKIFESWFYDEKATTTTLKSIKFEDGEALGKAKDDKDKSMDSTYDYKKWYVSATLPNGHLDAGDVVGVGITAQYINYLTDFDKMFKRCVELGGGSSNIDRFFDFLDDNSEESATVKMGYRLFKLPSLGVDGGMT